MQRVVGGPSEVKTVSNLETFGRLLYAEGRVIIVSYSHAKVKVKGSVPVVNDLVSGIKICIFNKNNQLKKI